MKVGRALIALAISIAASGMLSAWLYSAGTGAQEPAAPAQDSIAVDWDYRPDDVDDLTSESEAVVEATVTAIAPGDSLLGETEDSPAIPTRRVSLHVTTVVAGEAPPDLDLFQLGSATDQVETDPAYEVGRKYLLFIRRRGSDEDPTVANPDGTWIATAPDGRLEKSGEEIDTFINGPVAEDLEGGSVDDAVEQVDPSLIAPPLDEGTVIGGEGE